MSEVHEIIWGRREADGTITELSRAPEDDLVDPIMEIPGYAAAVRRGVNISFRSDNKALVAQLRGSEAPDPGPPEPPAAGTGSDASVTTPPPASEPVAEKPRGRAKGG